MPVRARSYRSRSSRLRRNSGSEPRESAHARGYGRQWQRLREEVLADEPLCRHCVNEGIRHVLATDVDHIRPTKGLNDPRHFDRDNLQPLCSTHHKQKTIRDTQMGLTR